MEYKNLVRDFAERTIKNLEQIEILSSREPKSEAFETTQLINSLLGLIVFPKEAQLNEIPTTPLVDLVKQGWAIPQNLVEHPRTPNLHELIIHMRHAVAHFNIEFLSDGRDITGVKIWNVNRGWKVWEGCLSIAELRDITKRFSALLLQVL